MSLIEDFTEPYSALESWMYDRMIAPSVVQLAHELVDQLLTELKQGAYVLDVGCGGGQLACSVAEKRPDLHVVGVDISREQVTRARKRMRRFGDRVRALEGSALALPCADASFDVVISVASIKHWPDPARGLRECVRVLRPGGSLYVIEADRGCRLEDAARFVSLWPGPRRTKGVSLAIFRTWVAGRSLDMEDARALSAGLALRDLSVERVPRAPIWLLRGVRA